MIDIGKRSHAISNELRLTEQSMSKEGKNYHPIFKWIIFQVRNMHHYVP